MKKITLILAAFMLIMGVQSYAQEAIPAERNTDQIVYKEDLKDHKRAAKQKRKRNKKKAHLRKRANQRQIRAMRKVAKADGVVSPKEKAVIKQERRKMKRNGKRAMKRKEVKRKHRNDNSPRTLERKR